MMLRHSPLLPVHRHMGATIGDFHGWAAPLRFDSPELEAARVRRSCGLSDHSWMVKLDLKALAFPDLPDSDNRCAWWPLGPGHVLATCEPPERASTQEKINSLLGPVYCTDVTSVYADLLLAGPATRKVLSKLTALDVSAEALADLACGQTSVAHVHAIVLRQDMNATPAFHVLVGRDVAESVWEAVLSAGREFDIAAFGLEARALI